MVQQAEYHIQEYLSWDFMSIHINRYFQYKNTDNIAIVPPFVSAAAQNLRNCRLQIKAMSLKLETIKDIDERKKFEKNFGKQIF